MALRPCLEPRCRALVPSNQGGRCDAHRKAKQQQADKWRGSAQERGYDSEWATFSANWRRQHPVCGMRADHQLHFDHSRCAREGRLNGKDLVTDHIVPLSDGGEKFDESNLQTLCRACNTAKDTGWGKR
jgi:5-methylcytosine-specific restriction protein A